MTDDTFLLEALGEAERIRADADRLVRSIRSRLNLEDAAPGAPERRPSAPDQWPPWLDTISLSDGGWLTIGQAATFIRKSECTIRRHAHEVGVKLGGTWWINKTRLIAHFAANAH